MIYGSCWISGRESIISIRGREKRREERGEGGEGRGGKMR